MERDPAPLKPPKDLVLHNGKEKITVSADPLNTVIVIGEYELTEANVEDLNIWVQDFLDFTFDRMVRDRLAEIEEEKRKAKARKVRRG